jgi:hypothetical protein
LLGIIDEVSLARAKAMKTRTLTTAENLETKRQKAEQSLPTLRLASRLSTAVIFWSAGCAALNLYEYWQGEQTFVHAMTLPLVLASISFSSIAGCRQTIATIEALRSVQKT